MELLSVLRGKPSIEFGNDDEFGSLGRSRFLKPAGTPALLAPEFCLRILSAFQRRISIRRVLN